MSVNYRHCYQILDLPPGSSREELRCNYKKLAQHCHPDRYQQDYEKKQDAEKKLRQLNTAYQAISDYYAKHGKMPLSTKKLHESRHYSGPEHNNRISQKNTPIPQSIEGTSRNQNWLIIAVVFSFLSILIYILLLSSHDTNGSAKLRAHNKADDKLVRPSNSATFRYADSQKKVLEVQGYPTRIKGNSWYYNDSRVDFVNQHVVNWYSSEQTPLHTSGGLPQDYENSD